MDREFGHFANAAIRKRCRRAERAALSAHALQFKLGPKVQIKKM
jgi:hypothetical protein